VERLPKYHLRLNAIGQLVTRIVHHLPPEPYPPTHRIREPLDPYGTVIETEIRQGQLFLNDELDPTLELTHEQIQAILNDNSGVTDGIE
jgi:hypothetical protein